MKQLIFIFTAALLISACSTAPFNSTIDTWSKPLPPRSYFVDYYAQDLEHQKIVTRDNYLLWIHRFYHGWTLYSRGWLQSSDELLATLPEGSTKQRAKEATHMLGKLIAPEWAKNRQYRLINTRHLGVWANALNVSVSNNSQLVTLDAILADVRALLAQEMPPEAIKDERYYIPEPQEALETLLDT